MDKYPRTPHTPWSVGGTADDKRLANLSAFNGKRLVRTEKLDGENTTMTSDGIHARSLDGWGKPWQTYLTRVWASKKFDIPKDMKICGENMYAVHSIEYTLLPASFFVFGVFLEGNALSWLEVEEWASLIGFKTVPVLGYGNIEDFIEAPLPAQSSFGGQAEGYVLRNVDAFPEEAFADNVVKTVREGHVQTDAHWTEHWKKANFIGEI